MSTRREKAAQIAAEPFLKGEPVLHCWENGPETIEQREGEEPWWQRLHTVGSTCMLPDGHEGEHEFLPDDRLMVVFAREEEKKEKAPL